MTHDEREKFWNTICSLPGRDIRAEREELLKTIKFPRYLYRYRPVNTRNLESLRTNMLYFSSANYYDDPFDTFLHIDVEKIRNEIFAASQNPAILETVVESINSQLKEKLNKEQLDYLDVGTAKNALSEDIIDKFLNYVLASREDLKKNLWSVCFSENGYNESLWLKYADCHKGFVLIYDLEDNDNFLCGKQEKCNNCGIRIYGTSIYPVYYSNAPYDATNFAKQIIMEKVGQHVDISIQPYIYHGLEPLFWEREKITLIKKECHKYDEEWRMLLCCNMNPPIMMEWIPSGIILGLHMKKDEENLAVCMAKEAGIKYIYKAFINERSELSYYLLKCFDASR